MMDKTRPKRKTKRVVMIEANDTEIQVGKNTVDILMMRKDINEIKENHLVHISDSIDKLDKKVEKLDARLWAIMLLVVGSAVANYFM